MVHGPKILLLVVNASRKISGLIFDLKKSEILLNKILKWNHYITGNTTPPLQGLTG